ncbi:MAG: glutamine-hydrolyzing carbamoyl-phosphate synthase small subunit [Alphaproteobacteria bacterium]|nr:glutamine-hydrolyzing carbamoyl-phosphate synthase small subunit [Alphaproteobacteria bacterium]
MKVSQELLQQAHSAGYNAALVLADGAVFFGHGIGSPGITTGEICFNTAMTGYQEILTDPSYAEQIITFTFSHIGNVGTNDEDVESSRPHAKGLVLRDVLTAPSNFRSTMPFQDWLAKNNITGISGVDTRALTQQIRKNGPQNVAICHLDKGEVFNLKSIQSAIAKQPDMNGLELAKAASTKKTYEWTEGLWQLRHTKHKTQNTSYNVVAIDYGVKHNILRNLAERGCALTVVPADTSAKDILAYNPDGVFLSNGPGDPAATATYALPAIKELLAADLPIFGICLGHQLLGAALGCRTEKMHQGHRGANHPVQELATGKVFITSQNHGFSIAKQGMPKNVEVTHISLFDKTIQGIRMTGKPVFSFQGHPEASPGPHDLAVAFDAFIEDMKLKVESSKLKARKV